MRDVKIRGARTAAVLISTALSGSLGLGTSALAQDAEPIELPTVEVTAPVPKKGKYPAARVAKKKSPSTTTAAASAEPVESVPASQTLPGIAVVGGIVGDRDGIVDVEGSAHVVDAEQLFTSHVFTTNEALKSVPGVHVRDEEGFGMRPNIGVRGLNPTRSTKTVLLEDGLFLTFAPYGDNASYFHPPMDRYERMEIIKGADQLLYGPQTIGGVVNYVTPNPPRTPGGFGALTVGNRDYVNGQVYYGGWYGPFGGQIDYVNKSGEGVRENLDHEVQDLGLKGIVQIDPTQALIGKFSYFKEDSQVAYTGITEAEARNFGIRYNPFENDRFNTERFAGSLTHNWDILPILNLASSVYWTNFDRDWWRSSSNSTDNFCDGIGGNPAPAGSHVRDRLDGVAINVDDCRATGRVRSYETYGFEQRATLETQLADGINNQLKVGYRIHRETQDRKAYSTPFGRPFDRAGDPGVTQNEGLSRDVEAWSVFAHNRVEFGAFSVTPMIRYENIQYEQYNKLNDTTGHTEITEVIPGVSVGFDAARNIHFFAGVHEGFSPPTVADSISGAGVTSEVGSEHSINFEAGVKSEPVRGLIFDGTYFRNDFDNLIATGSIAGGSLPLAEGEALFEGLELFARIDSNRLAGTSFNLYGQIAWTWLWTAEQSTPFFRVDNGNPVAGDTTGNRQPYAPEHLVTARIGYAQPGVFDVHVEGIYIGEQYGDFMNLETGADHPGGPGGNDALSGQFGKVDDVFIVNLGATYTYQPTNTDIFVAVKNVFDEDYIVDRTRGILPGAPRLFHVGVKQNF